MKKKPDPINEPNAEYLYADPLGLEMFVIDEGFEDLFNSLVAIYYRLHLKESMKENGNIEKAAAFLKKSNEINHFKRTFGYRAWEEKKKAIVDYSPKFRELLKLEDKEYS